MRIKIYPACILKIVIDVISSKTLVRKYVGLKRNNSRNPT